MAGPQDDIERGVFRANTVRPYDFATAVGEGRVLKGNRVALKLPLHKKRIAAVLYSPRVFLSKLNSLCEFVIEKDTGAKQGRATK